MNIDIYVFTQEEANNADNITGLIEHMFKKYIVFDCDIHLIKNMVMRTFKEKEHDF